MQPFPADGGISRQRDIVERQYSQASNGDDSFTPDIPATYGIRPDGIVAHHFADADDTKRLDPGDITRALGNLCERSA